jgi:uncharacterized protein
MSFWDSSAIVPLLAPEHSSDRIFKLFQTQRSISVWWGTPVECTSAISRRERASGVTSAEISTAFQRLQRLQETWTEVIPSAKLREIAIRLLRTHPLRAADTLQLAAAFIAAEEQPSAPTLVSLDDRLRLAAQHEGYSLAT